MSPTWVVIFTQPEGWEQVVGREVVEGSGVRLGSGSGVSSPPGEGVTSPPGVDSGREVGVALGSGETSGGGGVFPSAKEIAKLPRTSPPETRAVSIPVNSCR